MSDLSLRFVTFSVADVHATTGVADALPERWDVDAFVLEKSVVAVVGFLRLSRGSRRYLLDGVATFASDAAPVVSLDARRLADFVRGQASHLLLSHLRVHLDTLAGMIGNAGRFPASAFPEPDLLRSSPGSWSARTSDEAGREPSAP